VIFIGVQLILGDYEMQEIILMTGFICIISLGVFADVFLLVYTKELVGQVRDLVAHVEREGN
jgi:hypothetical protein